MFRGLFLRYLQKAFDAGDLKFFAAHRHLHEPAGFRRCLKPAWNTDWVVYAKRPFAGPAQVLEYVGRYTHRVAISNNRLLSMDNGQVDFTWKDYRHHGKSKVMTLSTDEFIRRFLLHVLPKGFHRIRHYGLLASATRKANVARVRQLLAVPPAAEPDEPVELTEPRPPCPCCGGRMIITETFQRWMQPRGPPASPESTGMMTP